MNLSEWGGGCRSQSGCKRGNVAVVMSGFFKQRYPTTMMTMLRHFIYNYTMSIVNKILKDEPCKLQQDSNKQLSTLKQLQQLRSLQLPTIKIYVLLIVLYLEQLGSYDYKYYQQLGSYACNYPTNNLKMIKPKIAHDYSPFLSQ